MTELPDLKERQLDALREVANIGAGHAATALSQLTHRRSMISVPKITITPLSEVPGLVDNERDVVAAVLMHMLGDVTGRTILMVPVENARLLCDLLLKREPGETKTFEEIEQSTLKEAGNIVGGAYLNALSDFMGVMLLPSVPNLVIDLSAEVLTKTYLSAGPEREFVLCVETNFHFEEADDKLQGHFLLLPDVASLQVIFDAIRVS
jgi:chemotaxis protein CheC